MSDKIPLDSSVCLLDDAVRFDGGHKRLAFAVEQLTLMCALRLSARKWRLACRRPARRCGWLNSRSGQRCATATMPASIWPINMQQFAGRQVAALQHLCGYIVCAKSPSCGMARVRVYSEDGKDSHKKMALGYWAVHR